MKTRADPYHDPVSILLDAAIDIREAHKPGVDGRCAGAECCSEDLAGGCLPYRTAETVLDLWADRRYLKPTRDGIQTGDGFLKRDIGDQPNQPPLKIPRSFLAERNPDMTQATTVRPHHEGRPPVEHPSWCDPGSCTVDDNRRGRHSSPPMQLPAIEPNMVSVLVRVTSGIPMAGHEMADLSVVHLALTDDDGDICDVPIYPSMARELGRILIHTANLSDQSAIFDQAGVG